MSFSYRFLAPGTALALGLALPAPARAQGKINIESEAPAPAVARSYHVHDGFYLRGNLGVGSLSSSFDDAGPNDFDLDGSGFALGLDLMIGGSPSPGVAIGGALISSVAPSATFDRRGQELSDRRVGLGLIGPFVDGFFDPKKGWHLGGMLGFAAIDIEDDAATDAVTSTRGLGGAAWLGYDFWVADEWSTGVLLRFAGAYTGAEGDETDVSASAFATTIMFTALYH
jgi:hypothetical protein